MSKIAWVQVKQSTVKYLTSSNTDPLEVLGQEGLSLLPHEYPLFDTCDMRELVSIFKDTEEDWLKWFHLVDGDGSSCEDEVVVFVNLHRSLPLNFFQNVPDTLDSRIISVMRL